MVVRTLLFFMILSLGGCATAPRQELQRARLAVAHADYYGAVKWAPEEFELARESLKRGEELLRQGDYQGAQALLSQVEELARQARFRAEKESAAFAQAQKQPPPKPVSPSVKTSVKPLPLSPPAPKPKPVVEPPPPPPPIHITVEENQTLWMIAARKDIYDDPLLWPLLYQANRDQIKDPRQIYPGQILTVPREVSPTDREEAREKARKSEIFPESLFYQQPPPGKPP